MDEGKKITDLETRLEEAKAMFEKALAKAVNAVEIAKEELTRPLTEDEKREIEEGL